MSKLHAVRLNRDLCMGCTNCIKRCPTEAIRVRDGKAVIFEERCIDCGECIRACPHHAKSADMDPMSRLGEYKRTVALAAPSLYTQFGPPATREMVLAALQGIGFDEVYEVALGAEIVSRKTEELLKTTDGNVPRPLISSACPAVVRLIQMKYPGLIPNLISFDSPMEVTARLAREEIIARTGLANHEIGLFFISPCPAKRTAIYNPIGRTNSDVDGAIAISDVYSLILEQLEKSVHTKLIGKGNLQAGECGLRWSAAGGEARALNTERYLAVDGIHNVIAILEEIENERLKDIDFIEANSCIGGCLGGPLTVANRFSGKARHRTYIKAAEHMPENYPARRAAWESAVGDISLPDRLEANPALQLDDDITQALLKYEQMKEIAERLPGLDCGACGAPNCEALAEDIVRGEASEDACIVLLKERLAQEKTTYGEKGTDYAENPDG
ncbi:MAG: [Fe-Fe] hydrogenase large subunit C-terminal domain-containing protein [Saccharofermentanales bacterium]|nr:4Fe-4S binding protein [Clostridiaceae bacterium]